MPQMQHAGGVAAILATHAGAKQANHQVGILAAPPAEVCVEAIDTIEISAPDSEIAAAGAGPVRRTQLAQRPDWKSQHRSQTVKAAVQPLRQPGCQPPGFRL